MSKTKQKTEQIALKIKEAVELYPLSMTQAAAHVGLHLSSFKNHAKKLGLYNPNPSHKGRKLPNTGNSKRFPLSLILSGEILYKASGSVLKRRLIAAELKEDKCEECGQLPMWNNKLLILQLDHIDGDHYNNKIENLRILCPNCHTQTPTHSGRNEKGNRFNHIKTLTFDLLSEVLDNDSSLVNNISELARKLHLNPASSVVRIKLKQALAAYPNWQRERV